MRIITILLLSYLLAGCSTGILNPNGTVTAVYNVKTGDISYTSDKSVNLDLTKGADGSISLKVQSDAASGINARNAAAEANAATIGSLIKLIPAR